MSEPENTAPKRKPSGYDASHLAHVRRDCCPCRKPEGVYGRGKFHYIADPEWPDDPGADMSAGRCPEFARLQRKLKECDREIESHRVSMSSSGSNNAAYSRALSDKREAERTKAYETAQLMRLKGEDPPTRTTVLERKSA